MIATKCQEQPTNNPCCIIRPPATGHAYFQFFVTYCDYSIPGSGYVWHTAYGPFSIFHFHLATHSLVNENDRTD